LKGSWLLYLRRSCTGGGERQAERSSDLNSGECCYSDTSGECLGRTGTGNWIMVIWRFHCM